MIRRKTKQTKFDKMLMMLGVLFFVSSPVVAYFIGKDGCNLFPPAVDPKTSWGYSCYAPDFWTFIGTLVLLAIIGGALILFSLRMKH
jgi:hypothetical protein